MIKIDTTINKIPIIHEIQLNLGSPEVKRTVIKQNSDKTHQLQISLYDNDNLLAIDHDWEIVISIRKPDNKFIVDSKNISVVDNVITVDVTKQMLTTPGTQKCELAIYRHNSDSPSAIPYEGNSDSDSDVPCYFSNTFFIYVEPNINYGSQLESTNEYDSLVDTLDQIKKIEEDAENTKDHIHDVSDEVDTLKVNLEGTYGELENVIQTTNNLQAMLDSHDFVLTEDKDVVGGVAGYDTVSELAERLDEINENAYSHPASAAGAKSSDLYKIATDANGHVTAATAVTKNDITGLGIPSSNTWRGIQDNLTSTSTTDSLSANQGMILDGKISEKIPLSGSSAITGSLTPSQDATCSLGGYTGNRGQLHRWNCLYSKDINTSSITAEDITASEFIGDLTGNADTATKATKDGSGNTITNTYWNKTRDLIVAQQVTLNQMTLQGNYDGYTTGTVPTKTYYKAIAVIPSKSNISDVTWMQCDFSGTTITAGLKNNVSGSKTFSPIVTVLYLRTS